MCREEEARAPQGRLAPLPRAGAAPGTAGSAGSPQSGHSRGTCATNPGGWAPGVAWVTLAASDLGLETQALTGGCMGAAGTGMRTMVSTHWPQAHLPGTEHTPDAGYGLVHPTQCFKISLQIFFSNH